MTAPNPILLYNTLTRAKEVFTPLAPGAVGIYTCGPTVYHSAHIGNLRSYVFPDVLKKTLRLLGYRVMHVINITDVGHLTSDADTGEDKVEKAARLEHRSAWDIALAYEAEYLQDLDRLHIERPDVLPRATGHIAEQIALVQRLEARGCAYRTADGIYFDTASFPGYGALARLRVEGLQEGSRVEMGDKRHKTDFALWKFSPPGAQRQMEWDSPWGRGFPGWHIECSAMSMRYLGETFDIHTGGSDHIPVHHTNEIAQSEAATGRPFVRYWLHGEHLVLGEERRMGKSEGNFITLQALVERGYDPMAYRYLVLNTHYRKYLNFSFEALDGARAALQGLRRLLKDAGVERPHPPWPAPQAPTDGIRAAILADLCDDLNTPKVLATLWTLLRDKTASAGEKQIAADYADRALSLDLFDYSGLGSTYTISPEDMTAAPRGVPRAANSGLSGVTVVDPVTALGVPRAEDLPAGPPADIVQLAEQRIAARAAKNYAESDRLRDELRRRGWEMRDSRGGYELVRPDA